MDRDARHEQLLDRRAQLSDGLVSLPYDLLLYLDRAVVHSDLGYPDLAAGDAYRALLLADEVADDAFEYHHQALESLQMRAAGPVPDVLNHGALSAMLSSPTVDCGEAAARRLAVAASVRAYQILSLSLLLCGCLKTADSFCRRGLQVAPGNLELMQTQSNIRTVACLKLRRHDLDGVDLPDRGLVRREVYPWNDHEPDRFSPESLAALNAQLGQVAPKCAVQVATLPVLLEGACETDGYDIIPTCRQLGLFALQDVAPGEVVLTEHSILTANNRLQDPACDACSAELPPLGSEREPVSCDGCQDVVFCSRHCHDEAQRRYHPAVCDKDVDAIAKDPAASEADEALYLLLLARALAMAAHEDVHPLDVREVRFLWGDFVPTGLNDIDVSLDAGPPPDWTLPFSFHYNIEAPLHVLERMDVDIFSSLAVYDVWVFNTLYAKFRGTASARKSVRDGRPDVAAVHPYWCLANHDCDPNVGWDWGGRMVLQARTERVVGGGPGGIRRGDEIVNHYCDVSLPVQQRREWARGSLGGWCMCRRCRTEAAEGRGAVDGDAMDDKG
ncbi:hypothetical protein CDD80_217 [Ophiocordyceps camponoti-rufipedis]|uniref:MYND-type domain-containing protein n=1 Tax=Ophiocordyceps camponoti-rufipedis TaxID=2004952 RepID=A0A2C5YKC3_9HYPO|nr:hypothetical protein CDD80_217 [Ophiocordyceps camponoti-rufipedis]